MVELTIYASRFWLADDDGYIRYAAGSPLIDAYANMCLIGNVPSFRVVLDYEYY